MLDSSDLKRAQAEYASALFIVGSRTAPDPRQEDEMNTLRAWTCDEYAPLTPLVSHFLFGSFSFDLRLILHLSMFTILHLKLKRIKSTQQQQQSAWKRFSKLSWHSHVSTRVQALS